MIRCVIVPTYSSASAGTISFVTLFTNGRSHPATFNTNDRSKIALYFLLLCGIISNGEVFKFDGGFCFMPPHLTMVANTCAAFSHFCASSYNADEWRPLVTDDSILSGVHLRPTETRHPNCAYGSNKFAAGCRLAIHLGNTIPRNFPSMTPSVPVNSSSNRRPSSSSAIADLFCTNIAEHCPVLVLAVQLPPTRSTWAFFSGWHQIESARPNLVLHSVLGIVYGRSDLS